MHSYYAGSKFSFLFPEGNNVISWYHIRLSLVLVLVPSLFSAYLAIEEYPIQAG